MLQHQIIRFLLVGCVNTVFSYSIYAFFIWCGLVYGAANFLALSTGIAFSFYTQGKFVFRNLQLRLLWRFTLSWLLIYAINVGFIAIAMSFGFNAYVAGALAVIPTTLLSFITQKLLVFRGDALKRVDASAH